MFKWLKRILKKNDNEEATKEDPVPFSRDIIDDLQALNEKYIKMFIDIHTHESLCDDDFVISARKATSQQYAVELALRRAQTRSTTNEKFYLAEGRTERLGIYTYRRRFKRYSSPMKAVLDERIERETEGYLNGLIKGLEPPEQEEVTEEQNEPLPLDIPNDAAVQDVINYVPEGTYEEVPDVDLDELYGLEEESEAEEEPQQAEVSEEPGESPVPEQEATESEGDGRTDEVEGLTGVQEEPGENTEPEQKSEGEMQ